MLKEFLKNYQSEQEAKKKKCCKISRMNYISESVRQHNLFCI